MTKLLMPKSCDRIGTDIVVGVLSGYFRLLGFEDFAGVCLFFRGYGEEFNYGTVDLTQANIAVFPSGLYFF